MLLVPDNKQSEDYSDWSRKIGQTSELGVELNVLISYSADSKPDWQIIGIVGVPRFPEDDYERQLLANKLVEQVEAPDFAVFSSFGVVAWSERVGGPFTVDVIQSRALREVRESDVSTTIEYSGPGPLSDPVFRKHFNEAGDWAHEYSENRYLRFEERVELNQRYQDLMTNITILTNVGAVDLTNEKHWHRLFRHVVHEMFMRGQPPVPHNFDPAVEKAILFPDKELCERAVAAVSEHPMRGDRLVKYGEANKMRRLYERGHVYMNSASYYDQRERHNQAVYDRERVSVCKGAVVQKSGQQTYLRGQDVYADLRLLKMPGHEFLSLFQAPGATKEQFVAFECETVSDFWVYCMSETLIPRLFADFEADACVVLDRQAFIHRVVEAWRRSVPEEGEPSFGSVKYDDPVGVYADWSMDSPGTNYFTKTFRYAYQREFRFVGLPKSHSENLRHIEFEIGPLDDIGELIVL